VEVTWIAIIASLCMGMGAVLIFVFAVKRNYFKNIEEAKYQVFWSELEDAVNSTKEATKKDDHKHKQAHA
jgi:hypothetical protein